MKFADVLANRALAYTQAGDARASLVVLPDACVQTCVTSPPYYLQRDYSLNKRKRPQQEVGREVTPEDYVQALVEVFAQVRRVLREDGTLWLNLGDTYNSYRNNAGPGNQRHKGREALPRPPGLAVAGLKNKDLVGTPWMAAMALRDDGWYLRQWFPWVKGSPMPDSASDRPGSSCEHLFLLSKSEHYYYDFLAVRNDTRNWRNGDLWQETLGMVMAEDNATILGIHANPVPSTVEHFAMFPPRLIEPMIMAGTSAAGCCPVCGTPYERRYDAIRKPTRPGRATKVTGDSAVEGNRDPERHVTHYQTIGWVPGCVCESEGRAPPGCVVLDPFAGCGTTAIAALKLGRRFVGCELYPENVAVGDARVKKELGMFA